MKSQRTRSQARILQLLETLDRPLSAQDIYAELRQRNYSTGLATVYRALEALKLAGALQVRTLPSGESLYDVARRDRHYLTCLHCDRSLPLAQCPVSELERELQRSHNFRVFYHNLEFFGLCDLCQDATPTPQQQSSVE